MRSEPKQPLLLRLEASVRDAGAVGYTSFVPQNHRNRPCKVGGCPNLAYAKEFCNAHYIRSRKGKCLEVPLKNGRSGSLCRVCDRQIGGKGGWSLCQKHYRLARRDLVKSICIDHLGGRCADCLVEYDSFVYDFHHADPSLKEGSISALFQNGSLEEIASEVLKCELLCANCHRIRHYGQG